MLAKYITQKTIYTLIYTVFLFCQMALAQDVTTKSRSEAIKNIFIAHKKISIGQFSEATRILQSSSDVFKSYIKSANMQEVDLKSKDAYITLHGDGKSDWTEKDATKPFFTLNPHQKLTILAAAKSGAFIDTLFLLKYTHILMLKSITLEKKQNNKLTDIDKKFIFLELANLFHTPILLENVYIFFDTEINIEYTKELSILIKDVIRNDLSKTYEEFEAKSLETKSKKFELNSKVIAAQYKSFFNTDEKACIEELTGNVACYATGTGSVVKTMPISFQDAHRLCAIKNKEFVNCIKNLTSTTGLSIFLQAKGFSSSVTCNKDSVTLSTNEVSDQNLAQLVSLNEAESYCSGWLN